MPTMANSTGESTDCSEKGGKPLSFVNSNDNLHFQHRHGEKKKKPPPPRPPKKEQTKPNTLDSGWAPWHKERSSWLVSSMN